MLRFVLNRKPVKRLIRGIPILGLLSAAEVAIVAKEHLAKLDPAERRRLLSLVARARGRPGSLDDAERDELGALVAKLEPRQFVGATADRLSPLPMPKRLLYGPRKKRRGAAAAADGSRS